MAKNFKPYGVKVEYDGEAMTVGVTMFERSDEGSEDIDVKTFNFNDIGDEAIQARVSVYGLSKILQDRTSDMSDNPARLDGMQDVFDRLSAGQWQKEREASGRTVNPLVEALADIKGVEVSVIQTKLRSLDADVRDKILAHPKVVEKAAQITAGKEEKAEGLSLDDLAEEEEAA